MLHLSPFCHFHTTQECIACVLKYSSHPTAFLDLVFPSNFHVFFLFSPSNFHVLFVYHFYSVYIGFLQRLTKWVIFLQTFNNFLQSVCLKNSQCFPKCTHSLVFIYNAGKEQRLALSCLVAKRWKRAMTAPSNSVPRPVFTVAGEKAFHTMVSQMLVAMKREMPDPRP